MNEIDYIFVGLGNPGIKYQNNRHNIGWLVVSNLALKHSATFSAAKYDAYQCKLKLNSKNILLLLPTTYMNNSGIAIRAAAKKYNIPPENIIVLVDEYNFPLGKMQLKKGGSAGGHNGIKSVIYELNTEDFYRLRLGIDKNFGPGGLVNYVLSNFDEEEKENVINMIKKGVTALEHICKIDINRAMSDINSAKLFKD